jgi:uncharacterized protein (TIGR02444 family)
MTGEFWTWLNAVYRREGVSPAVIELQDKEHLNVNAALYCCWLATKHRRLSRAGGNEVERLSKEWSDAIVAAVRSARRELKTSSLIEDAKRKDVRARIQATEIELEEVHAGLLERLNEASHSSAEEPESLSQLAADNLRAYLAARGTAPGEAERIASSPSWQTVVNATLAE